MITVLNIVLIVLYTLMFRNLYYNRYVENIYSSIISLFGSVPLLFGCYLISGIISLNTSLLFCYLLCYSTIYICAIIDYDKHLIPNICVLCLLVFNITISLISHRPIIEVLTSIIICTAIYIIYYYLLHLGAGDIKFIFSLSFILNMNSAFLFIGLTSISLLMLSIVKKNSNNTGSIPLGPIFYLCLCLTYILQYLSESIILNL